MMSSEQPQNPEHDTYMLPDTGDGDMSPITDDPLDEKLLRDGVAWRAEISPVERFAARMEHAIQTTQPGGSRDEGAHTQAHTAPTSNSSGNSSGSHGNKSAHSSQRGILAASAMVAVVALLAVFFQYVVALHGKRSITAPVVATTTHMPVTATPCNPQNLWRAPANNIALSDISMVSPTEGWAIGENDVDHNPPRDAVIFHLIQGQWQTVVKDYPEYTLDSISMISPVEGWAVGEDPSTGTGNHVLVLHYTDGQWQRAQLPFPNLSRDGMTGGIWRMKVQMFPNGDGWLFAFTDMPRDPKAQASRHALIVLHRLHGIWSVVPEPPVTITTEIADISAISADELWAVGADYQNAASIPTLFAHYRNGRWNIAPETFADTTAIWLLMNSPTDGWAVGSVLDAKNPFSAFVAMHYDGAQWTNIPLPDAWVAQGIELGPPLSLGDGTVWFSAAQRLPNHQGAHQILIQYDAGQWQQIDWPFTDIPPDRLIRVSTGEIFGFGNISHQINCARDAGFVDQGVFFQFANGAWTKDVLP